MSSVQRAGLLLLVVFSVTAGGAWQAAEKPPAVQKWEYKELKALAKYGTQPVDVDEKAVNKLGDEGWELVAASSTNGGTDKFYFKRPKQ